MSERWLSKLRLVELGVAAGLRNSGIRAVGLLGVAGAAAYAWSLRGTPGTAGIVLAMWLGRAYGVGAGLWFAYQAVRDQGERSGAILRSKPADGAMWVFVTWLTGVALWLALLAAAFAAAAIAGTLGGGSASLLAEGWAFGRAAYMVTLIATLSYALARLMRSPLGGLLILFAWFCAMGGAGFIPLYLRPDYGQNMPLFAPLAALLLCVTALLVERARRGELRSATAPAVVLLALVLLGVIGGRHAYAVMPRTPSDPHSYWAQLRYQHIQDGKRVPGFWLPDGHGGRLRTADRRGRILLIYLFAADDTEAARTLPALEEIKREFGSRGVDPIAVCLSPDHSDGEALANTAGYHFPIGTDSQTVRATEPPDSPVADAYDAQVLPVLVVTDRFLRTRKYLVAEPFYDVDHLRLLVNERLAAEPE